MTGLPSYRSAADILRAASLVTVRHVSEIVGEYRSMDLVLIRSAVALVMINRGWSKPRIGRSLNRDHSTVFHSLRRYGGEPSVVAMARQIEVKLESPTWRERCREWSESRHVT